MRLQIDTAAKTIKLEQSAKITEILSVIKKLLPNDWKEYSLETNTVIYNWQNPIYVYPYYQNPLTFTADSINGTDLTVSSNADTVYNFEVQSN